MTIWSSLSVFLLNFLLFYLTYMTGYVLGRRRGRLEAEWDFRLRDLESREKED